MLKENGTYYTETEVIDDQKFYDLYLRLSAEEMAILAHQSTDLIKSCSYLGVGGEKECAELMKGAKKLFSPRRGVCYMFNNVHNDELDSSLFADWPGPTTGLELIMNIEG